MNRKAIFIVALFTALAPLTVRAEDPNWVQESRDLITTANAANSLPQKSPLKLGRFVVGEWGGATKAARVVIDEINTNSSCVNSRFDVDGSPTNSGDGFATYNFRASWTCSEQIQTGSVRQVAKMQYSFNGSVSTKGQAVAPSVEAANFEIGVFSVTVNPLEYTAL